MNRLPPEIKSQLLFDTASLTDAKTLLALSEVDRIFFSLYIVPSTQRALLQIFAERFIPERLFELIWAYTTVPRRERISAEEARKNGCDCCGGEEPVSLGLENMKRMIELNEAHKLYKSPNCSALKEMILFQAKLDTIYLLQKQIRAGPPSIISRPCFSFAPLRDSSIRGRHEVKLEEYYFISITVSHMNRSLGLGIHKYLTPIKRRVWKNNPGVIHLEKSRHLAERYWKFLDKLLGLYKFDGDIFETLVSRGVEMGLGTREVLIARGVERRVKFRADLVRRGEYLDEEETTPGVFVAENGGMEVAYKICVTDSEKERLEIMVRLVLGEEHVRMKWPEVREEEKVEVV